MTGLIRSLKVRAHDEARKKTVSICPLQRSITYTFTIRYPSPFPQLA